MLLPFTYPFSFKIWVLSLDLKLLWYYGFSNLRSFRNIDGRPYNFVQLMCRTPHQIAITALRSRVLFWISRIWKNYREQEPGPKCDSISWPHGPEPGSLAHETIWLKNVLPCDAFFITNYISSLPSPPSPPLNIWAQRLLQHNGLLDFSEMRVWTWCVIFVTGDAASGFSTSVSQRIAAKTNKKREGCNLVWMLAILRNDKCGVVVV